MDELKPYPEYKDSGILWMGRIPSHWRILPNRAIFSERIIKNNSDEELLSVTIKGGLVRQKDFLNHSTKKDSSNEDKSNYKLAMPGDLVYNKMRMWQGAVGASNYRGIVSPAYIVITPRFKSVPWYFHFLFRTPYYIEESHRYSYGICDDQLSLRFDDFKVISTPLPPPEEQKAIVSFIEVQNHKINRLIRIKRRIIEILKEQKQAIINKAVARGIDPNVKLKPSGIDWLGDIPEHWDVLPLRRVSRIVKTGGTPPGADEKYYSDEGFYWYTPGDFNDDLFLYRSGRQLSDLGKDQVVMFPANTVMMIGIGATIGKVSITTEPASCNQQINGIILNEKIAQQYLAYYLRCLRDYIVGCGKYTTIPIINQDETKTLLILLPPNPEQSEIVEFINASCKKINMAILHANQEIDLIREYRTRLISDVVTGKVDVRGIPVEKVEEIAEPAEALLEEGEELEEAEPAEEAVDAD